MKKKKKDSAEQAILSDSSRLQESFTTSKPYQAVIFNAAAEYQKINKFQILASKIAALFYVWKGREHEKTQAKK